MKSIITFAIALLSFIPAMAQDNSHLHVFRSDNNFHSHKASKLKNITFEGSTDNYTKMVITDADGTETIVSMDIVDSLAFRPNGIADLYVNLIDYPYLTDLMKDATHTKETIYSAILRLEGNGQVKDIAADTVEFRGRGNSTWNMPKTPYRFKMKKKQAIGDLPKAKSFAVIANYIDCSLMRNSIALWIGRKLGLPHTNHTVPCNVYINNNYRGSYVITEKIGVGSGSVDIDEYRGLLFELDSNFDENYKFGIQLSGTYPRTTYASSQSYLPVMVKDPDLSEICDSLGKTPTQLLNEWGDNFQKMVYTVMTTPASGSIASVIDIEQAAKFFLVNGIANNHEMKHPKSLYIHKDSIEGLYKFGPVWDFDWAFTFDGKEGMPANVPMVSSNGDRGGYTFLKKLMQNEEFRAEYKKTLDDFKQNAYPELLEYMNAYADNIEPFAKANGLKWPADHSVSWKQSESSYEFRENYKALCSWIEERLEYMSNHVNYGLYE